jgi:hypothetical protein
MDAEGWLHQERKLLDRAEWTPPEMRARTNAYVTLREYADEWLALRDLSPKTRASYRDLLRLRILPGLGHEMLQAITPAMVRAWWVKLPETPTRNAMAYRVLTSICATAIEDKLLKENPAKSRRRAVTPAPAMSRP